MQVTESKIDELTREFKVAVPAADIEQKIMNRLNELARTVRLPGFRPGKVPISLLRKRYEAAVKSEIVEETINQSSSTLMKERGLRLATTPSIQAASFSEQGDLEYTMAVELLPDIPMVDFLQIELERLTADLEEAQVEKTLERLANAPRSVETVAEARPSRHGDIIVVDFEGRINGESFAGGNAKDYAVELGSGHAIRGFEDHLVGVSAGDQKQVVVTFPEDYANADLAGKQAVFDVQVKELREAHPASLNDQFAQKFGLDSVQALKDAIREEHARELKALSRMRLKRALLDELSKLYSFDLPKGMVEREFETIVRQLKLDLGREEQHDQGQNDEHAHDHTHEHEHEHGHRPDRRLTPEEVSEYRALAERRVRLGLVLAEVGRANNLKVTQEELNKAMISEARRFVGQEQVALDYFRKNPEATEALAAPILEDKVVDFILEMAKVTERKVPAEELLSESDETSDAAGAASGTGPASESLG